jgi:hypothetical protein
MTKKTKKVRIFNDIAFIIFPAFFGAIGLIVLAIVNARYTEDKNLKKKQILIPVILFIVIAGLSLALPSGLPVTTGVLIGLAIWLKNSYFQKDIDRYKAGSKPFLSTLKYGVLLGVVVYSFVALYVWVPYAILKRDGFPISFGDWVSLQVTRTGFDAEAFDRLTSEFSVNEDASIKIDESLSTQEYDTEAVKALLQEQEVLWSKNVVIANEIESLEGIPKSLLKYAGLLDSYSQYRREEAKAFISLINTSSKEDEDRLYSMRSRADQVLKEISEL